ncbi:MAG: hypothetical protein IJY15_04290, partial [Thermoguttaceae bacterium]|nr:hypothetical protein [Thermoguttaceae bacterium]
MKRSPRKICERFWDGWRYYDRPTFVTFNGRGFDVPLMELTAFRYLVFDIESVADPALIAATRTNFETEPTQALREYRDELMEKKGSDFIPHTFQVPISLALGKVRDDFSLADITVLRVE